MAQNPAAAPAPDVPIRLQYGTDASPVRGRRGLRVAGLVALLPALVVPFVPFACDRVPVGAVGEAVTQLLGDEPFADVGALGWALLVLTFFLPVPLVVWKCRRLPGRPAGRAERVACAAAGWAGMLAFAGFLVLVCTDGEGFSARDWALLAACTIPPGVAVVVVVLRRRQRRGGSDDDITALLTGPYVGALGLLLVAYTGNAQLGWWLSLAPVAAAAADLGAVTWLALRGGAVAGTGRPSPDASS